MKNKFACAHRRRRRTTTRSSPSGNIVHTEYRVPNANPNLVYSESSAEQHSAFTNSNALAVAFEDSFLYIFIHFLPLCPLSPPHFSYRSRRTRTARKNCSISQSHRRIRAVIARGLVSHSQNPSTLIGDSKLRVSAQIRPILRVVRLQEESSNFLL